MRKHGFRAAVIVMATAMPAWSQEVPEVRARMHRFQAGSVVAGEPAAAIALAPQGATFNFLAAEGGFGGRTVKGAPYTGEGVTEFTQTLADGTRIKRQSSSKFARDGEGRTRYEHTLASLGPWAPAGEAPTMVTIHDPVSNTSYMLNDKDKIARKMKSLIIEKMEAAAGAGGGRGAIAVQSGSIKMRTRTEATEDVVFEKHVTVHGATAGVPVPPPAFAGGQVMLYRSSKNAKTESLGKQAIEGLVCDGTREIHTIPAGEVGNDRPIETVTERWYSPELQVMVMSRTNDPMSGETVYRLTNVRRAEPDKSLFQVPQGYTVKEAGEMERVIHMERE
jgi:hypothetical protein